MIYIIFSILTIWFTIIYYRRPIKLYKPPPSPPTKKYKQTKRCTSFIIYKTIRTIPKGYKIKTSFILKKGTVKVNNKEISNKEVQSKEDLHRKTMNREITRRDVQSKDNLGITNSTFGKQNLLEKSKDYFVYRSDSCAVTEIEICEIEFASKYYEIMFLSRMMYIYSIYFKQLANVLIKEKVCVLKLSKVELVIVNSFLNIDPTLNSSKLEPIKVRFVRQLEKMYKLCNDNHSVKRIHEKRFGINDKLLMNGEILDRVFFVLAGSFSIQFDDPDNNFEIGVGSIFGFYNSYFGFSDYAIKSNCNSLILYIKIEDLKKCKFREEDFDYSLLKTFDPLFFTICARCEWNQYMSGEVFATKKYDTSIVYQGKVNEISKEEYEKEIDDIDSMLYDASHDLSDDLSITMSSKLPRNYEKSTTKLPKTLSQRKAFGPGSLFEPKQDSNKYYKCVKKTDIINVPQSLILQSVKILPSFALSIAKQENRNKKSKSCKTVLITLSSSKYHFIIEKLQNAITGSVLVIHESDLIFSSVLRKTVDCNQFYNYIRFNESNYDLILIIIEQGYDNIAKQIIDYCDTLLMIGKVEPEMPIFCSVEMVNIYQDKVYGNKISKFFNFDKLKMKSFTDLRETLKKKYKKIRSPCEVVENSIDEQIPKSDDSANANLSRKSVDSNGANASKESSVDKDTNAKGAVGDNSVISLNLSMDEYDKNNAQIFVKYDRIHHISSPKINNFCSKDFERLARSLLDKRIGVVLSGGGARGLAHIGVIQALEEEGIPIDIIGGTSMGAFVGALYARNCDNISVYKDTKLFVSNITSKWRALLDLTYPVCSMFSGHAFNRILHQIFQNLCIEDLWIDYYCISTNVTLFEEVVHRKGLLWRFVRASMSLAGYLPPICEEQNGHINLLLDGGYVNNIPIDIMQNIGADKIIAIDVGSQVINDHYNYGETLNGFYVLFHRFFGSNKFLSMDEVQYRLAYLSDQNKTRELDDTFIIRPKIDGYKTLDFGKYEEIVACGYTSGRMIIKQWKENGVYKKLVKGKRNMKRRFSI